MNIMTKIAAGIVTTVFAGGLIAGGVYRTQVKSEQELQQGSGENGVQQSLSLQQGVNGEGQGLGRSADGGSQGGSQGGGGEGRGVNSSQSATGSAGLESESRGTGYRGGNGSGETAPLAQSEADVHPEDLVSIRATVHSMDLELVLFLTGEGESLVMEGRSLSFALEQGLVLSAGDDVRLEGFFEDGEFEISSVENVTTGQVVVLREPEGRPLWAGGAGRRGGS